MKGVFSLLAAGTFLCLLTNTALADDNSINSEPARQSLLSIWDKPAFSPAPDMGLVPWPNSRPAKGQRVDFLLSPNLQSIGPNLAQKDSWPARSDPALIKRTDAITSRRHHDGDGWRGGARSVG
jgi:hypothetical protein